MNFKTVYKYSCYSKKKCTPFPIRYLFLINHYNLCYVRHIPYISNVIMPLLIIYHWNKLILNNNNVWRFPWRLLNLKNITNAILNKTAVFKYVLIIIINHCYLSD